MKLADRIKDFLGWTSIKYALCYAVHGRHWQWARRASEIDTDVAEYFCPHCEATRFKRDW